MMPEIEIYESKTLDSFDEAARIWEGMMRNIVVNELSLIYNWKGRCLFAVSNSIGERIGYWKVTMK